MVGIDWATGLIACCTEAVLLDVLFGFRVAGSAQRLEFTQAERVPIAMVWLDMISHSGHGHPAIRLAEAAERVRL